MSSVLGNKLRVSVFGQSHGSAIGVVIDGLPAGKKIDMDQLNDFLARRKPGTNALTTKRKENDLPIFLSGIVDDITCGFPLAAIIENTDVKSADYANLVDKPRPGHADYAAYIKYGGYADMRGGGHFSGRLTAPLCIAGGIALQLLAEQGIYIGAHISSVGDIADSSFKEINLTEQNIHAPSVGDFPVIDCAKGALMQEKIKAVAAEGDSIGGTVECAVIGLPPGIGEPMFDGIENRLARGLFGIPAVKGIEFGTGFASAAMLGSQNNDDFEIQDGKIVTSTNNHGGILGGISSGMPIIFRVAIKPTPSIAKEQNTVSLSAAKNTTLKIEGRHDPCIAVRAVPCVEGITALVILDMLLEEGKY